MTTSSVLHVRPTYKAELQNPPFYKRMPLIISPQYLIELIWFESSL